MAAANHEVVVFKHVCKFCSKSFPCGRSLGGHMRSHVSASSSSSSGQDELIIDKHKLTMSIKNARSQNSMNEGLSHELRENPKRTWRAADPSDQEDALLSCRACGKVFQSSKALFGHMKSHSEKETVLPGTNNSSNYNYNYSLVDDSWASASNQKLEVPSDNQSDIDESTVAPQPANQLRKSSRRRPRYMGTAATSSSLSLANNPSSSVSEIDQHEQEEVALSLIMLSRDLGQRRGSYTSLNSTAAVESYENNYLILETEQKSEGKGKNCKCPLEVDNTKLKSPNTKSLKFEAQYPEYFDLEGRRKVEISASGFLKYRPKMKKLQLSDQGHVRDYPEKEPKMTFGDKTKVAEVQLRKQLNNDSILFGSEFDTNKVNQWERKLSDVCDESGKMEEVSKSSASDCKRWRFECTTCNKVFHSYQALGGHRASHKKIKGCSFLKPENCKNSLETDIFPCSRSDTKLGQPAETVSWPKKDQKHECPICFKVFLSGQALGGHKRSHLIPAGSQATTSNHQSVSIQKPTQEVREFLDLNLPAPVEEEANNAHVGLNPWWHEPLLGHI